MKKLIYLILIAFSVTGTSCIKQLDKVYTGQPVVEIEAAVLNSRNVTGFDYPILLRVPRFTKPVNTTSDPTISRTMTNKTIVLRANLIASTGVLDKDEHVAYRVLNTVTPAGTGLLGVSGTHFTTTGVFTIPKGSTFGDLVINVLDPVPTPPAGSPVREVHIELIGSQKVRPSENYKRIAIRITQ